MQLSRIKAGSLVLLLALGAAPALGHESRGRNRGTIARLTAEELAVRTADGHVVTYRLSPETRFERGGRPATREDAEVGERVVVEGTVEGAALAASRVKLAPAGPHGGEDRRAQDRR